MAWRRGALPTRSREIRVTPGVEIKGAVHAREMPRLRHVFLDNLFGNINHRERHEMLEGVRASVQRGSMHRRTSCFLFFIRALAGGTRGASTRPTNRRLVDSLARMTRSIPLRFRVVLFPVTSHN